MPSPQKPSPQSLAEPSFDAVAAEIKRLVKEMSLEVTPKTARDFGDFSSHFPAGTRVFITHLPGKEWQETIETAIKLHQQGMQPTLHIAARTLKNEAELTEGLAKLADQNIKCDFLLLGGGGTEQVGPFSSSMDLLDTEKFTQDVQLFFAGHPEGSPDIQPEMIKKAIVAKNAYSQKYPHIPAHLVTQFCFTFEPISAWLQELSDLQNKLAVAIGIPGIASIKTLFNHAKACGIGNSIQFLTKQSKNLSLLKAQNPNKLVRDIATHNLQYPAFAIHSLHLYPFGGLEKNIEWRNQILEMPLIADAKNGFKVAETF